MIDCTLPRAPSPHAPHRALPTSLPLCYLTALYPAFFLSIAVTCTAIYFRTTVLKGEVGAGKGCQLTRCRCVGALVSCFESLRLFILSIFMPLLSQIWNKLFDFTKKKKTRETRAHNKSQKNDRPSTSISVYATLYINIVSRCQLQQVAQRLIQGILFNFTLSDFVEWARNLVSGMSSRMSIWHVE